MWYIIISAWEHHIPRWPRVFLFLRVCQGIWITSPNPCQNGVHSLESISWDKMLVVLDETPRMDRWHFWHKRMWGSRNYDHVKWWIIEWVELLRNRPLSFGYFSSSILKWIISSMSSCRVLLGSSHVSGPWRPWSGHAPQREAWIRCRRPWSTAWAGAWPPWLWSVGAVTVGCARTFEDGLIHVVLHLIHYVYIYIFRHIMCSSIYIYI